MNRPLRQQQKACKSFEATGVVTRAAMAMTTKPPSSHSAEWPFPFEHALLQVPSGLPLLALSLATLRLHDSNRHKPLVMSRAASLSLPGVAQLGLPRERRVSDHSAAAANYISTWEMAGKRYRASPIRFAQNVRLHGLSCGEIRFPRLHHEGDQPS